MTLEREKTRSWLKTTGAALALSAAAVTGANAQTKVTMYLDFLVNGYHAPFYVANEKGWYREAGLDVKITPGRGTADSIKNVAGGHAQFGFPDFGAVSKAVADGVPIVAVAAILQEVPGGVISFGEAPIRKPKDLEGISLAVAPFGATAILLPAFANLNGVDMAKVKTIKYNFGAMVPSFLTGKVDATVGYYFGEYLAARDKSKSMNKSVTFMPLSDFGIRAYANGIVVNRDFMAANPEAVKGFVRTTIRALEHTIGNIDEAAAATAKHTETPVATIRDQLVHALELIDNEDAKAHGLGVMVKDKWDDTQRIQVEFGKQKSRTPDDRLWTNRFVK